MLGTLFLYISMMDYFHAIFYLESIILHQYSSNVTITTCQTLFCPSSKLFFQFKLSGSSPVDLQYQLQVFKEMDQDKIKQPTIKVIYEQSVVFLYCKYNYSIHFVFKSFRALSFDGGLFLTFHFRVISCFVFEIFFLLCLFLVFSCSTPEWFLMSDQGLLFDKSLMR